MSIGYADAPRPYGVEGVKNLNVGGSYSTVRHGYGYGGVTRWGVSI